MPKEGDSYKLKNRIRNDAIAATTYTYLILGGLLHKELGNPSSPASQLLTKWSDNLNKSPEGQVLITNVIRIVTDSFAQAIDIKKTAPELISLVDGLLIALPFLAVGGIGLARIIKSLSFNEAKLLGLESVKANVKPSQVIISSSTDAALDLVTKGTNVGIFSNRKKSPVILVHANKYDIPYPILSNNLITHHFGIDNESELVGTDKTSDRAPDLIEDSALDRAKEITIYCLPNSYSTGKDEVITAEIIEPLLLLISGDLKGKSINLIVPDIQFEDYKGHFVNLKKHAIELQESLEEKFKINFTLNLYTPEDAFAEIIRRKVIEFAVGKGRNKNINLLHIEQSMLGYTSKEDKQYEDNPREVIKPPNMMNSIWDRMWRIRNVAANNNVYAENLELSMGDVTSMELKLLNELTERIAEVDYCVLTADSDKEAITMTKRLILEIPSLKGKLMVMVDSKSSAEKLKESDLLIDTFVPSEGVIDAFIKDKTTQK